MMTLVSQPGPIHHTSVRPTPASKGVGKQHLIATDAPLSCAAASLTPYGT